MQWVYLYLFAGLCFTAWLRLDRNRQRREHGLGTKNFDNKYGRVQGVEWAIAYTLWPFVMIGLVVMIIAKVRETLRNG